MMPTAVRYFCLARFSVVCPSPFALRNLQWLFLVPSSYHISIIAEFRQVCHRIVSRFDEQTCCTMQSCTWLSCCITEWTFIWKCRRDCETFPEYNADFSAEVTPMTSNCAAWNKTYVEVENEDGDMQQDMGCFVDDGYWGSGENLD